MGFVGGAFGWELSAESEAAAIDFATGELVKLFGADARKQVTRGLLTDWADNTHTLGAYAAARLGHFDARRALSEPVGGRLFFAGEVVAGSHMALCSGAWMSGDATARGQCQPRSSLPNLRIKACAAEGKRMNSPDTPLRLARDPRYDILFEPVQSLVIAKNRFYQVPHCTGMGRVRPQTLAQMRAMKAEGG